MHFYNNFRYDALPTVVLCGIVVAILHVSHRQATGSPWVYPWIYAWISIFIFHYFYVDMFSKSLIFILVSGVRETTISSISIPFCLMYICVRPSVPCLSS